MARRASREQRLTIPGSVSGVNRRTLLRGALGAGALLGAPTLLSACGDDTSTSGSTGGGGGGQVGNVKFGINEAKGSGPAYERLQAMADAYAQKNNVEVSVNAVDHNTFQESITTYLQGTPDDVFTWFAGYRMAQFAEAGQIADLSGLWPIDGLSDAFKKASTAADGNQYFVPVRLLPVGRLLPEVGLRGERLDRCRRA